MKTRLISGLSAAALLVALIYRGGPELISIVVVSIATAGYWEFDRMVFTQKSLYRIIRMAVLIAVTLFSFRTGLTEGLFAIWFSFATVGIHAILLANRNGNFLEALNRLSLEWLGFFYSVSLVVFVLPLLKIGGSSKDWLLLLFLIVFCGDSFAYFGGKLFGKHRLASNVSPKKTLEGGIGGLLGSALAAWIWATWIHPFPMSLYFWFLVLMTSLLGQLGDLLESLLKRSRSQKDSGAFLPGHGGLLDRLDGLVFSSPFFYYTLRYFSGAG